MKPGERRQMPVVFVVELRDVRFTLIGGGSLDHHPRL